MTTDETTTNETKKNTQLAKLLAIADVTRLFNAPGGDLFIEIPVNGRYETHSLHLNSKQVRDWFTHQYFTRTTDAPNKTAMEQLFQILSSKARYGSPTLETHLRIAHHDGAIYVDLCNAELEVVKVTAKGWSIVESKDVPVRFKRPNAMKALPTPERGGDINDLRPFLNVPPRPEEPGAIDQEWMLIVGWLIGAFHPNGPYAILALHGEKGSAKSTTTRYLRMLVDPNEAMAPERPSNSQDLAIKAQHNWIVAIDNVSSINLELSDALCRLCTGSSVSKRVLYSDTDQIVLKAKRPIILNGINEVAKEGDLLDRSIIVTLPVLSGQYRTEQELDAEFMLTYPRLFGAVLDAVAMALKYHEKVQLDELPRLADFARWVVAAQPALGWENGSFMAAFSASRDTATALEIESNPIASALLKFMQQQRGNEWKGPAEKLHELLSHSLYATEDVRHHWTWPKNGQALSARLTRLAGALRKHGLDVVKGRDGTDRVLIITRLPATAEASNTSIAYAIASTKLPPTNGEFNGTPKAHLLGVDAIDAKITPFPKREEMKESKGKGVGEARQDASTASTASRRVVTGTEGRWGVAWNFDDEDEEDGVLPFE